MGSGLFPLLREDAEHPLILIIQGWVGTSTVPALEQMFWRILLGRSPDMPPFLSPVEPGSTVDNCQLP